MYRKLYRYLFALFTLTYGLSVWAQANVELRDILATIPNMRANFTQTMCDDKGNVIQTAHGWMALARPAKLRWEVTQPIAQIIIANQDKIWIYDPDLAQLTIRYLKSMTGDTPALLFSHPNQILDKQFKVKRVVSTPASTIVYQLTPKKQDGMFAEILLEFNHSRINAMHLKDHLGHITHIKFDSAKINTALPARLFTFNKTANIDVIDETQAR
jgi:outer membrane lipoprotein carrier protein